MTPAVRQSVRRRAQFQCEYCHLKEKHLPYFPFQLDHIIARQHGQDDDLVNLAWACHECNLHKGTNLSSVDPDSNEIVRLFNPRTQIWADHFFIEGLVIRGRTAVGRATVRLLQLNSPDRRELRGALAAVGEWPA